MNDGDIVVADTAADCFAIAHEKELAGGGDYAFGQVAVTHQRVDHRALARVEFAHHHQQEHLIQLLQAVFEQGQVVVACVQPGQGDLQGFQNRTFLAQNFIFLNRE